MTATSPVSLRMGATEYGLIALQSMLWGSSYFLVAVARDALPPITMSALRLIPAMLILLAVVAWFRVRLPATRAEWKAILWFCLANNVVPFLLVIIAQRTVPGGTAAIFNATVPLFAVFLAAYFIPDERLSWRRVVGILIGITGVAILVGGGTGTSDGSAGAKVMLIAAAACYAIANVYARLKLQGFAPFSLACAQMLGSFAIASVLAVLIEQPWTLSAPSTKAFLSIMGMGIFSSALASLCHLTVLKRAGATNAVLVTIILPLTPILLGALFIGEQISLREAIGALVIGSALIYIDGRAFQWLRGSKARSAAGRQA